MTEYLLGLGAPLDICTAAMLGRGDVVDAMLAADPAQAHATGAHGLPVLYYPMPHAELAIAESLLAAGADVNAGDGMATPLHATVSFNQPAMARWLLDHGAKPARRITTARHPWTWPTRRDWTISPRCLASSW